MDLGLNLNIKQKTQVIITPKLQTAINLLGYSTTELSNYIKEMVNENPLLEAVYQQDEFKEEKGNLFNYENFVTREISLSDFIESQLYQVLSEDELEIGRYIIGNLDDKGFLSISLDLITEEFGTSVEFIKDIINRIQKLEPPGIASTGYQESLLVQLQLLDINTELAEEIVKNYLYEVAESQYDTLSNMLNVKVGQVVQAVELIKSLNPYPAAGFAQDNNIKYIIPDLVVEEKDDQFILKFNNFLPELKINQYYYNFMKENRRDDSIKYLKKKYDNACWLIKSVKERQKNIYNVASMIIEEQEDFLRKGIKYLYSMSMAEIANKIGIHESTVYRATTEKYIQTPQGLFELKYFFNSGIGKFSSLSIKAYIAEIIKKESINSPLSDQQIAKLIAEFLDIDVSRRTIAKYRAELGFLSSKKRKRCS